MAEFKEKEFKAHLKQGELLPVYLIMGDEDFLKKHYFEKLISLVVDESLESFNLERFEGKNLQLEKVLDACEQMPMMSDKRCVTVEDFRLDSLKETELSLMQSYFVNPPDFTVLIFYQRSNDFSAAKSKKLIELFKSFGAVCVFNKRTGAELTRPLISSAAKQGCSLSPANASYLVSVCGDDFNVLSNEVNKLCSFVGSGEITAEHIDELATKTDDAKIYLLTKSLISKNFDKAYETLSSLFRQKTEPEYILGTLISAYVDMYRAKVSLSCKQNADALASDFEYKNTAFRLTNAARDARGTELSVIRQCLDELFNADRLLKSSRESAELVFEQLMVRLFLIANGEKV